jgi:hypothetical protein
VHINRCERGLARVGGFAAASQSAKRFPAICAVSAMNLSTLEQRAAVALLRVCSIMKFATAYRRCHTIRGSRVSRYTPEPLTRTNKENHQYIYVCVYV